jgi:KamA family protein
MRQTQKVEQRMKKVKYINKIDKLETLDLKEKMVLKRVSDQYAFRSNDYYLSLIDWTDPGDPIRRLVVPDVREIEESGKLDPSDEERYTIMPGLQHKYRSTAVLLISGVCGGICRYCFRKRIFLRKQTDILRDLPTALDYIRQHDEITNILLTGGDPFMLTAGKLESIIGRLFEINHVRIIRIGTKMLSFNPYKVMKDDLIPNMIERLVSPTKRIYVMTHFSHPKELTEAALEAITKLQRKGAVLANQTPLIHGINDDPAILAQLFQELSFVGVPPYYLFQCRPALGNQDYSVPIEEGYEIFEKAKAKVSGLAKRARYVLSHTTGKLEVVGLTESHIYFKYHRAAKSRDSGTFLKFERNPEGYWLDDYDEAMGEFPVFSKAELLRRDAAYAGI